MRASLFEKIQSLLALEEGSTYAILDVGCGDGDLLGGLAGGVAEGSFLVGLDPMKKAIDQARERFPRLDFRQEKFTDTLNFQDAEFDVVISVDMMECIPDKAALRNEIHRVLKPGGKVLAAHWDWGTQVYNSRHKDIVRNMVAAFSDWEQDWMDCSDGWMGRRLWGLFQEGGLFEGRVEPFVLVETNYAEGRFGYNRLHDLRELVQKGRIDKKAYEALLEEMQALNASGEYFYSLNSYIYMGRK